MDWSKTLLHELAATSARLPDKLDPTQERAKLGADAAQRVRHVDTQLKARLSPTDYATAHTLAASAAGVETAERMLKTALQPKSLAERMYPHLPAGTR